jgi:YVTN family beta-propeller protein
MSLPANHRPEQARRNPCGAGVSPALALLALCVFTTFTPAAEPPLKDRPLLRRPIAAAWIEPGKLLAVANQRSGTVSVVDIPGRKVLDEIAVGEHLADIAVGPRGSRLFAVDEERHELIILDRDGESLRVVNRVPVSPYPVSIAISPDGSRIAVASLWSRKLTVFEPSIDLPPEAAQVRKLGEIPLPFAPRAQCFLNDGKQLVVADSFGGQLACIGIRSLQVEGNREIDGHNIRGLATSPVDQSLFMAHSHLMRDVATTRENSVDEDLMSPVLTQISLDVQGSNALTGEATTFRIEDRWSIEGGSDPQGLVRAPTGKLALVLGGSRQLSFLGPNGQGEGGRRVRNGPVAIAYSDAGTVVVCRLGDSLVVVPMSGKDIHEIVLGPNPTLSPADRGERSFYSGNISFGRWMSCHSCHTDGHTNGQLADTLGDGTYGTPKRIPTLLGTRLTDKWAWNGEVRELHEQVQKSLENTMHAPKFSPQDVLDITAFLHTLPPPPPLQPATKIPQDMEQLARGETLFGKLGCEKCHVPPLTYTSPEVYDVGLEDEKGLKKFNPPSLRGVSEGYSFFHDGRAKSLEAVFTEHGHQLDRPLEKDELADLLRFLRSL